MPRGIYQRKSPSGFLHPQNDHRVTVDGIGDVYAGRNRRSAQRAFDTWVAFSRSPMGRASGKRVVLTINGGIVNEHAPMRAGKASV